MAEVAATTLAFASFTTLAWVIHTCASGKSLLPYEPRRPVPWKFAAVALALALPLLTVSTSATLTPEAGVRGKEMTAGQLWGFAGIYSSLAVLCYVLLATMYQADAFDLGLPQNARDLLRDIGVGAIAYLASIVPVYAIQLALTKLLEPHQTHPIIEQLQQHYSPGLMLAAAAGAVVGAPLFEETAFRLIFQGWLERHESGPTLGANTDSQETAEAILLHATIEDSREASTSASAAEAIVSESQEIAELGGESTLPLMHYAPDRPCNWAAILISTTLFALAHVGQGVAPISLLPLGMALGYVYQRTHRIVPSMVCHALFNATSLTALWLELGSQQS